MTNQKQNSNCKVYCVAIQKGGVAKTTSSVAISAELAELGYKVLLIDNDPQANSSRTLGQHNNLQVCITNIIDDLINFRNFEKSKGIITTKEGFDILPSNDSYAGIELQLISIMNREYFLKKYIEVVKSDYDYIIIDCPPNLGMLTINALVAADELLIPAQAQDYSATSIQQILNMVKMVRQYPNPNLKITGVFLTMFNERRKEDQYMRESIKLGFSSVHLFNTTIPFSIRVSEAARQRMSIIKYESNGKVSQAYKNLVKEVMSL